MAMKISEKQRHESLQRLLSIAFELAEIEGPAALASALGQSEQTVTNWGSRGVSKAGAILAQEKLGCSANWILHNALPRLVSVDVDQAQEAQKSPRKDTRNRLDAVMQDLAGFLAKADPEDREALQGLFSNLVRKPHDERIAEAIKLMLDSKAFAPTQKISA